MMSGQSQHLKKNSNMTFWLLCYINPIRLYFCFSFHCSLPTHSLTRTKALKRLSAAKISSAVFRHKHRVHTCTHWYNQRVQIRIVKTPSADFEKNISLILNIKLCACTLVFQSTFGKYTDKSMFLFCFIEQVSLHTIV